MASGRWVKCYETPVSASQGKSTPVGNRDQNRESKGSEADSSSGDAPKKPSGQKKKRPETNGASNGSSDGDGELPPSDMGKRTEDRRQRCRKCQKPMVPLVTEKSPPGAVLSGIQDSRSRYPGLCKQCRSKVSTDAAAHPPDGYTEYHCWPAPPEGTAGFALNLQKFQGILR